MYALSARSLLLLILTISVTHAARLSHKAIREIRHDVLAYRSNVDSKSRQGPKNYLTILRGLLRSRHFVQDVAQIPCDTINTLENDAEAARDFITQLEQGQVPEIIQDLPEEVIGNVQDAIKIAISLPTEILGAAEAAVTDAVKVFDDIEDGSIVSDLARVPGIVVSDITAGWGSLTNGLVDAWDDATSDIACFFGDCPTPSATAGSCAAATTTSAGSASTSYISATTTSTGGGILTYSSASSYPSPVGSTTPTRIAATLPHQTLAPVSTKPETATRAPDHGNPSSPAVTHEPISPPISPANMAPASDELQRGQLIAVAIFGALALVFV